jgi:RimJ/RimL family protein N-acetyltransferase
LSLIMAARPASDGMPARQARVLALDPATVSMAWDADDIDEVYRYRIQWNATGRDGRPIVRRQIIEREGRGWVITDAESRPDQATWTQTSQVDWPWEFSPIVDAQNLPAPNEVWGNSDLEADIIALQNAMNFTVSNVQRIIRYHAHPKTWGSGFNAAELRAAVDEMIVLPNAQAQLHNLEMQSDLDSSLALYDRLRQALHALLQVPEVATGKLDTIAGTISGVALQILYQPLMERVEDKRETYGEMLLELNRRLLIMAGMAPAPGQMIWPEVIPRDPMAERQAALLDQQLGVSQDTLLQQLGYEPDNERAKSQVDAIDAADRLLTAMDRRPLGGTA